MGASKNCKSFIFAPPFRRFKMMPPIEPKIEDCCNSGCNPCIFDVYDKQLERYKKFLEVGETSSESAKNGISQLEYTSFLVVQSVELLESHKLLAFKKSTDNVKVNWNPGDHFLIKYSSGSISCTRAYTPLLLDGPSDKIDFSIIVKIYDNGLVSNYLNNLKEGMSTIWRGPYGSYELVPNKYDRIVLIAQGTGIVTFIPIIQNIINNEDDMTRIILYYCCKSKDTILLREELYLYKSYWNFTYKIYLSSTASNLNNKYQEPIYDHKLDVTNLENLKPISSRDQFLLCGSSQFMRDYETFLKEDMVENIKLF